jgi:hypothetical protein
MTKNTWKYLRVGLVACGLVGALVSCNSHMLLKSGDPEVVIIDPPDASPPPKIDLTDAGVPSTGWDPVTLGTLPDGAVPDTAPVYSPDLAPGSEPLPGPEPGADAGVVPSPDLAPGPDLRPPPTETLVCPAGQVRVHVRDLWSSQVSPTMNTMSAPPLGVIVIDPTGSYQKYGARLDGATDIDGNPPCTYYSVCIPNTIAKIQIQPLGTDACPAGNASGAFDISSVNGGKEFWIEYTGSSGSTMATDYAQYPNVPIGSGRFHLAASSSALTSSKACKVGTPPDETPPAGYTKVHFRWPWNDPTNPATPYAGSACPVDVATKLGFTPPPYPSSLKVTGVGGCELTALLEFQDGTCPWYYVMIPNADWPASGTEPSIVFRYPDESKGLFTNGITLPARGTTNEFWIAYAGAPDNKSPPSATVCQDWSLQTNSYFVYTANPGPGCAGSAVTVDPCAPPQPNGYHTVHFRYIWAGQKTFTMFPKPEFMPKWIEMEVNSGSALKVICWREQDRPWFECPVPDSSFVSGATWRAVDKLHDPEWNTVAPRPFPSTAKDYWLRWYYGKPDIPRTTDPPNFKFFDYYPDGTNGDWSATGVWNDSMCAPKPPATAVTVGFGNGAWFPYTKSQYKYPYGLSLAYVYPQANQAAVQDLLNAFTWERYGLWKQNWVKYDNDACGTGTAMVWSDNPSATVSEGLGYGMAITAGIGDKDLLGKLWLFVRHYLSQSAKKYCGGLMGWEWHTPADCRPLDSPCDTSAGDSCGGIGDSAFDGDVDIAIGLVYAALQWPNDNPPQSTITWQQAAIDWLTKMECEVDAAYDGQYNYPSIGDTDSKDCSGQPGKPCVYAAKQDIKIRLDYYPPGYFRVFGDFLAAKLGSSATAGNGQTHHDFWYRTAQTDYKMIEQCYDSGANPGLVGDVGSIANPCASSNGGTYEELRALWRVGIDAAWFGNNTTLPENTANSSTHYAQKSQMQAKIDNSQDFFTNFYKKNPVVTNANRFSSICDGLNGTGAVTNCDPALGHNSYTVNMGMCSYVSLFNDGGATTSQIRREAIEEAVTTTIQNDHYFQESLGVYSILFLTGNFPNPVSYSGL